MFSMLRSTYASCFATSVKFLTFPAGPTTPCMPLEPARPLDPLIPREPLSPFSPSWPDFPGGPGGPGGPGSPRRPREVLGTRIRRNLLRVEATGCALRFRSTSEERHSDKQSAKWGHTPERRSDGLSRFPDILTLKG